MKINEIKTWLIVKINKFGKPDSQGWGDVNTVRNERHGITTEVKKDYFLCTTLCQ